MKKLDPNKLVGWNTARKCRPMKAKPLVDILSDLTIIEKLLLNTLEGNEPLRKEAVICIGEAGDIWQQLPDKLFKKYRITQIDAKGWWNCEPVPDNEVECIEVQAKDCEIDGYNRNVFAIVGNWGETIGEEKNIQQGQAGDFICRNPSDPKDVWIVRRYLFLNTYIITG